MACSDRLFGLDDEDVVFFVGEDRFAGRAEGFLHFAVARAGEALSRSPRCRGCVTAAPESGSTSG